MISHNNNDGASSGGAGPHSVESSVRKSSDKQTETYADLRKNGLLALEKSGLENAESDVRALLCAAAGQNVAALFLCLDKPADESVKTKFYGYIDRRIKREPVQYIVGEWEFMGLPFWTNGDVLIPRPETELLVKLVIAEFSNKPIRTRPAILDLCTGSGCIAISVAAYVKDSFIVATDISVDALRVSEKNAEMNNVIDRIAFIEGDLYKPLNTLLERDFSDNDDALAALTRDRSMHSVTHLLRTAAAQDIKPFDVICANPPYVATEDLHTLPEDVLEYEPKIALDGGPGGFGFFYAISSNARKWLKPGGLLAVEIGAGQARNVEAIFASDGHADVNTICDYNGIGRIVYARAK